MGTFAGLYKEQGSMIPKDKREEFANKLEKLFQAGGMMNVEKVQLYGKSIYLIRKVRMEETGMHFSYNYFEDDSWESAGFDKENCRVWSGKIGWSHFHRTIVAAYVLEELYTEGIAATLVDGDTIFTGSSVGWINYLFDEKNHINNFDPWKLFESIHYSEENGYIRWYDLWHEGYGFIGGCEVYAVENGCEEAIAVYSEKKNDKGFVVSGMKRLLEGISTYKANCENDRETQLKELLRLIRLHCETEDVLKFDLFEDDEYLKEIDSGLILSDSPAFAVKAISEIYEVEFWELWEQVRDVASRKLESLYGNEGRYIIPISTKDFLHLSYDDMIPYWQEDCEWEFSEELQNWFASLKEQYDTLLDTELAVDSVLKYIMELLSEVNENYYGIYAFGDFFEESLENLRDKRYLTFWKIFDDMIHDPVMKEAGDVIFVPDGPEHEREGLHYLGEQPKRRLNRSWSIMDLSKKNNQARVSFRRYMALLGNKELRYKVFGV